MDLNISAAEDLLSVLHILVVCTSGCILRSFGYFSHCAVVTVISVVFVQLLISTADVSTIENPDF